MRYSKVFVILSLLTLLAQSALSQEEEGVSGKPVFLHKEIEKPFFKINNDLRRIGLDEICNIAIIKLETGSYKLDPDFQLGYGDVININLWGKIQAKHRLTIDRDGNIIIPLIGMVNVVGLTLDEAQTAVKGELDKKYSNVELDLNLANVQNIRIEVLGNVKKPSPYVVSPFCRIVEAVAGAGGPNDEGSIIDIQLIRDGKKVVSFNTYDYIFKADQSKNLRLKRDDTIYIPEIKSLVAIRGDVRYPGIYETENGSALSKAIDSAGGILPTKLKRKISILRINPATKLTEIFKEVVFELSKGIEAKDDIILENHDTVIITTALDYTPYPKELLKTVHIYGEVKVPGDYLIREGERLSSLIKRAGGLKDSAFGQGAIFTRGSIIQKQRSISEELVRAQEIRISEKEAHLAEAILTQEEKEMRSKALEYRRKALSLMASRAPNGRIIIDLEEIMNDKTDIVLEKGDSLYVPPIPDWVLVTGAVYNPQAAIFEEGKTLEYYLNASGGANRFADKEEIYIIKANGRAESKSTGYNNISPGDIIVVPGKME